MKTLFAVLLIVSLCSYQVFSQKVAIASEKSLLDNYSPSLFCHVILYRTALSLPDFIVDTLNAKAAIASVLQANDPDFNIREYERGVVKELLTDYQYTDLLVFKNQPIAAALTANIWSEMLKQHLVSVSDSLRIYGGINGHLLTSLVTREYFADDRDERSRQLAELDLRAPSALYRYFHHGYEKPVTGNPYRAQFVW